MQPHRIFYFLLTLCILVCISAPSGAQTLNDVVEAYNQLADGLNDLSTTSAAVDDLVKNHKAPPPTDEWKHFVVSVQALETKLHGAIFFAQKRGDVSPEAQNDCSRYEGVLAAFGKWADDLKDVRSGLPDVITKLQNIYDRLDRAHTSARQLADAYGKLAGSEGVTGIPFTAAYLDMSKVEMALNGASGEANKHLTNLKKTSAGIEKTIADAETAYNDYKNRMPAMRTYCAGRGK